MFLILISLLLMGSHSLGEELPFKLKMLKRQLQTESNFKARLKLSHEVTEIYFQTYRTRSINDLDGIFASGFVLCGKSSTMSKCRMRFVDYLSKNLSLTAAKTQEARINQYLALGASTELNDVFDALLKSKKSRLSKEVILQFALRYVTELLSQLNYGKAQEVTANLEKSFAVQLNSSPEYQQWNNSNQSYIQHALGSVRKSKPEKTDLNFNQCKKPKVTFATYSRLYALALDMLMKGNFKATSGFAAHCHRPFSVFLDSSKMVNLSRWVDFNTAIMLILNGSAKEASLLFSRFESTLPQSDKIRRAWLSMGRVCQLHKLGNKSAALKMVNDLRTTMKSNLPIYGSHWIAFSEKIGRAIDGKNKKFEKGNHLKYCFI